jgi:shikimate kinase
MMIATRAFDFGMSRLYGVSLKRQARLKVSLTPRFSALSNVAPQQSRLNGFFNHRCNTAGSSQMVMRCWSVNQTGKSIILIGMMGAGKSLVGKVLEQKTGFPRFDTDELISSKLKMPIDEIFSTHGEEYFRNRETETLHSLSRKEPAIIVTGGGIVLRAENIDLLKQMGTVIWLDANEATLRARIRRLRNRPLLRTAKPRASLSELRQTREPLYRKASDLRVDVSQKNPEGIAELIIRNIRNFPIGE